MRDRSTARRSRRQLWVGLLVIPLSLIPFAAYGSLTPEGRLLKDKAALALDPPELPRLDRKERAELARIVPRYDDAVMPLVYHGIGSSSGEGRFAVSPDTFAEHLAALRAGGMHFVMPERVAEAFAGGRRLPPRAVLLTFDDGRTDAMMWATPLLEQASAVATMFVIAGAADEPSVYYAGWDDLERYHRGPWDLQAHTGELHREQEAAGGRTLPALTARIPGEDLDGYRSRIAADLDAADAAIAAHTGRRPVAFAYPFGAYGAERTNDRRIRDVLAEEVRRRYALAFHQDEQESVPLATPAQDRAGLRRLIVRDGWSGEDLLEQIADAAARSAPPGVELVATAPPLLEAIPPLLPATDDLDVASDVLPGAPVPGLSTDRAPASPPHGAGRARAGAGAHLPGAGALFPVTVPVTVSRAGSRAGTVVVAHHGPAARR